MSFDGLFYFYYGVCDGVINFDCIKDESIKSVTQNYFDKCNEYMKTNNLTNCDIMIGSNVSVRDCEFHKMHYDLKSATRTKKDTTILFNDILIKDKIMHLSTDFLFLRLDTSSSHIMKPYKKFINTIQPKFVLLNYHQNKVPISACDPEIKYYVDAVDGYKIIDKGASKHGQYYDILTEHMNRYSEKKAEYECYFVGYVWLLERTI